MVILSGFEFLTLGGVFLGVKNNSKNKKMQKILCFYELMAMLKMENFLKCHKSQNYAYAHMNIKYLDFSKDS